MRWLKLQAMMLAVFCLTLPTGAAAQQTIPQWDCCVLIYSTGRWLGWAAAYLEATQSRQAPSPFDQPVFQQLQAAGENVQLANRSCSPGAIQAWPGWRQKLSFLNYQMILLRNPSSHQEKRRQVYVAIKATYNQWGNELAVMRVNGRTINETTCSTLYFRLGYTTAYTAQALRHANEQLNRNNRLVEARHQIDTAVGHLRQTLRLLTKYDEIQQQSRGSFMVRCAAMNTGAVRRDALRLIENINSLNMLGANIQSANRITDGIADIMTNNCNRNIPQPPPQPLWTPEPEPTSGPNRHGNARCNRYATRAVQQYKVYQSRGCGKDTARWQSNFDHHYDWCVKSTESSANYEDRERGLFLQNHCR